MRHMGYGVMRGDGKACGFWPVTFAYAQKSISRYEAEAKRSGSAHRYTIVSVFASDGALSVNSEEKRKA